MKTTTSFSTPSRGDVLRRYVLPIVLWMGAIFLFSSVSGSGTVYEMPNVVFLERKAAHVGEYFLLTVLILRFFVLYESLRRHRLRVFCLAASIALGYAVSDEIHQLFVFGRAGKATDVFIDGIGVVLAGLLFFLTTFPRTNSREEVVSDGIRVTIREESQSGTSKESHARRGRVSKKVDGVVASATTAVFSKRKVI
jgi:VanZ family protein